MPFATKIPERWRILVSDAVKFGLVGAINTGVDFVVFNALLQIGPLKATVVSTIVATTTSYFMNRQWAFRSRATGDMRREYALFFAFNLVGMFIQLGVLGLVKYGLNYTEQDGRLVLNAAKAVGIGVAMIFRFWSYRSFVFKPEPATAPAAARDNIPAAVRGNTPIAARDTAPTAVRGNPLVTAYGNTPAAARDTAPTAARGDTLITARGDTLITARGDTLITARGDALITATAEAGTGHGRRT